MALVLSKTLVSPGKKELVLYNLTSGVPYLKAFEIIFNEFNLEGLKLTVPACVCSSGHNLMIIFCPRGLARTIKILKPNETPHFAEFIGIGKVESYQVEAEDKVSFFLRFTQYSPTEWQKIISSLQESQNKSNALLNKMKGVS